MKSRQDEVGLLNKYRRSELSAVETYDQVLDKLESTPHRTIVLANRASHAKRAKQIALEINRRKGRPADGSGPWGAFTKALEGGAKLFGAKPALKMLEEGEDHGCRLYGEDLEDYSTEVRAFVRQELEQPQRQTHRALAGLVETV